MEIDSTDFLQLHRNKYDLFKAQNPENGRFDVIFEVEGKLLYAHKTMLTLESHIFDRMLSDRWTPKKPVKIETCSYDNFYQFLTFLYSAQCELNDENIYAMVDIAEIYCVKIFKNYCQKYLSKMEVTIENIFQLMDLIQKYSTTALPEKMDDFVTKNASSIIASDGFSKVNKIVAKALVMYHKYKVEPEDVFKAVYIWSEKRAQEKQVVDPTLNLNETIKNEISAFLPHILFHGMDSKFLQQFVVSRGFIFSSWNTVSKILCDRDRFFEGKVKVTNSLGQALHGNVIPDKTVLRNIESLKLSKCYEIFENWCWWKTTFKLSLTVNPLKQREGVEWYLVYLKMDYIGVKHCSFIFDDNFLLAELTTGDTGFQKAEDCKIEIV